MKEKLKNMDKRKLVGIVAIVMAISLAIFIFSGKVEKNETILSDEEANRDEISSDDIEPEEAEINDDEENIQEEQTPIPEGEGSIGNDDITEGAAAESMNIDIRMLPEMEKEIPDMTLLKQEIEKYLIAENLWSDVSVLQSDFVITENYNKNTLQLCFEMNNYNRNRLVVLINKTTSTITLNHY